MRRLLIVLLLAGCGREAEPPAAPPPVQVARASVATATVRSISTGPRLSGTLQPQQSAAILAETSGTVVSVGAAEGQTVNRGAVLARIADASAADALRSARTAVQAAETAVAVARRDYERNSTFSKAGALPARDAEAARAQLAGAQSQLGQARAQLSAAQERAGNQTVTAPAGGVVSERHVGTGAVVTPGMPLFTIVDLSTLQLEASVPADALAQVSPGAPVDLEVRGYPGQPFSGTISRVAPGVDPATGQVRVYVGLSNQGLRLVAGLFAEGTVRTESREALVIPLDALDESGSGAAVMRIRNGLAERVAVQLGLRNEAEGYVEVISGLEAGDMVIVGPARAIAPGSRVSVG